MKKPVLVVLAAGMGSRFGGIKQLAPVGPTGALIIDYSIYDAKRAGFEEVIFIIKEALYADFEETLGARLRKEIKVTYAFQELDKLPDGIALPPDRIKPFGTAHAVLCAMDVITAPFAVINADDYYGPHAFTEIYNFLSTQVDPSHYAMVGYQLSKTVSDYGTVTRGVCDVKNASLGHIDEVRHIEKRGEAIGHMENDCFQALSPDTTVSMNLWGFDPAFLSLCGREFLTFCQDELTKEPLTAECILSTVVGSLLTSGQISVGVLNSRDNWHGITYQADLPMIRQAMALLKTQGYYPF